MFYPVLQLLEEKKIIALCNKNVDLVSNFHLLPPSSLTHLNIIFDRAAALNHFPCLFLILFPKTKKWMRSSYHQDACRKQNVNNHGSNKAFLEVKKKILKKLQMIKSLPVQATNRISPLLALPLHPNK